MFLLLLSILAVLSVCHGTPINGATLRRRAPDPSSASSGNVAVQTTVKMYIDKSTCTVDQAQQIEGAWEDAGLLAKAALGGRCVLLHSLLLYLTSNTA